MRHDHTDDLVHGRHVTTTTAHEFADPASIVVYGVDTCEDTTRAREHLTAAGRDFRYVRLDKEPGTRQRLHDAGWMATPVVVTPAGELHVEPSDEILDEIVAAT